MDPLNPDPSLSDNHQLPMRAGYFVRCEDMLGDCQSSTRMARFNVAIAPRSPLSLTRADHVFTYFNTLFDFLYI